MQTSSPGQPGESISQKYLAYRDENVVLKAQHFASYTVPALMSDPNRQMQQAEVLRSDYQSHGALLVNNLTAKLASALFPAGRPFHRLKVDEELLRQAKAEGLTEEDLEAGAAELERLSTEQLFKNAALNRLHRILKLVIVTGNCLVYRDLQRQRFQVWNLHSYVVRRDPYGEVEDIIQRQRVRYGTLPKDIQDSAGLGKYRPDDVVDLYTQVRYVEEDSGSRVALVQQYVEDFPVGEAAEYPEHLCPYIAVTWNLPDGEHYGRGYVEEYSGDFTKFSLMSEQLSLYELDSLSMLNLVDESLGSTADDYAEADIGDFVPGKVGGITAYERGDYNKIAAVRGGLSELTQRLAQAFMFSGNTRDAERVTAEEIRTTAQEAENLLGGTYSVLAEVLQAPLAYLCMYEVALERQDNDLLYEILAQQFRPEILTGIPALTQSTETQNLIRSSQEIAQVVPVLAEVSNAFDLDKVIQSIMRSNSVEYEKLMKSAEQLQQEAEDARQQEALLAASQEEQPGFEGEVPEGDVF